MKTDISEIKVAADQGRLFILLNVRTPTSHTIGRQRSTLTKALSGRIVEGTSGRGGPGGHLWDTLRRCGLRGDPWGTPVFKF